MATLINHITSISADPRSGSPPGRRAVAIVLCLLLSISAVSPGIAAAGEVDSESEGAALPVEAPVPELDPGGEETVLEDAPTPAPGGEEEVAAESEPVEAEPEIGPEAPSPGEVTGAATEAVVEEPPAEPVHTPEVDASPAGPQYAPQQEIAAEPVENRPLPAPTRADRPATVPDAATEPPAGEGVESHTASAEPSSDAPDPAPTSSGDPAASLAGKRSYVVRPGDCLTYIAEALLAAGASQSEIEDAVDRLWRLNEDRIGTGDPDVIYPGTVLRLR